MTLNYTTLVLDLYDGAGRPVTKGTAQLVLTAQLTDSADHMTVIQAPVPVAFQVAGLPETRILDTDNADPLPAGAAWTVTFTGVPGNPPPQTFFLLHADDDGDGKQYLSDLVPVSVAPALSGFMPLPTGSPLAGQVPAVIGDGSPVTEWVDQSGGGGGGSVDRVAAADTSIVIGGTQSDPTVRTGTLDVIATQHPPAASVPMNSHKLTGLASGSAAGDSVQFGQLGTAAFAATTAFDAAGAAATAQSAAETFATDAVAAETSRAEDAEALLAPLASPTLTGVPAAPTAPALTATTQVATTAYADAAVAVETSRAETAEALALPLAGGTMSGAIAMGSHKITGLTNGSVATDAAAFGQLPTLSSLGGAPLASPALTGTPTAPTAAALTDSTQLATTAYADAAVAVEAARAEAAEAVLGARLIYVDALGADPTGATFSDTAFAAAVAAGGSGAWQIVMGAGTYKLADSYAFGRRQGITGQGAALTQITCTGSGTCIAALDPSFDAAASVGGLFGGFTIDGTSAGSSAAGMSWGDMTAARCRDITIQDFTGATAAGLRFVNVSGWSEEAEWTAIRLINNTVNVLFDTNSFDYSVYQFVIVAQPDQDGIRLQNDASLEGARLEVRGNFFACAGNTGAVFALDRNAAGTGTSRIDKSQLDIAVEPDGSAGLGHFTVLMLGGSAEQFNGNGVLHFLKPGDGIPPFQDGTFGGSFGVAGVVEEPSLGNMLNGDALVVQGGSQWSQFGSFTSFGFDGMTIFPQFGDYQALILPNGSITVAGFDGSSDDYLRSRRMTFAFKQPTGGAAGTITWPANVKFAGGSSALSSTANAVDLVVLTYFPSEDTWYGQIYKGDAAPASLPLAGGTMSGAIAMGSHKITGLTNGSGAQDAAAFGQLPSSGTPLPLTEGGTGQSESTAALLLAALGALALAGGTMTGALIPAVVALTDASTVAINAALGNQFVLTTTSGVGTTRQLGAPSNPVDGQQILIDVIQDTSGSRVVTYNAVYDFGSGSAPTLSTGANKIDTLGFRYKAVISKWTYLGSGLGF